MPPVGWLFEPVVHGTVWVTISVSVSVATVGKAADPVETTGAGAVAEPAEGWTPEPLADWVPAPPVAVPVVHGTVCVTTNVSVSVATVGDAADPVEVTGTGEVAQLVHRTGAEVAGDVETTGAEEEAEEAVGMTGTLVVDAGGTEAGEVATDVERAAVEELVSSSQSVSVSVAAWDVVVTAALVWVVAALVVAAEVPDAVVVAAAVERAAVEELVSSSQSVSVSVAAWDVVVTAALGWVVAAPVVAAEEVAVTLPAWDVEAAAHLASANASMAFCKLSMIGCDSRGAKDCSELGSFGVRAFTKSLAVCCMV